VSSDELLLFSVSQRMCLFVQLWPRAPLSFTGAGVGVSVRRSGRLTENECWRAQSAVIIYVDVHGSLISNDCMYHSRHDCMLQVHAVLKMMMKARTTSTRFSELLHVWAHGFLCFFIFFKFISFFLARKIKRKKKIK
jgi:hypothetical protein